MKIVKISIAGVTQRLVFQLPKLDTRVRLPSPAPLCILAAGLLVMILTGCATTPHPSEIVTKPLGVVYGIAKPVISYPAAKGSFVWPVKGYVVSSYGSKIDRIINKGIDIKAEEGTYVKAAKAGRVVYCDPYMKGYGKTVILDHGDSYQTVYSYNSDILVQVGDSVTQNSIIAKVGKTGRAKEPSLHFEIRRDGAPQDPSYYLTH